MVYCIYILLYTYLLKSRGFYSKENKKDVIIKIIITIIVAISREVSYLNVKKISYKSQKKGIRKGNYAKKYLDCCSVR